MEKCLDCIYVNIVSDDNQIKYYCNMPHPGLVIESRYGARINPDTEYEICGNFKEYSNE